MVPCFRDDVGLMAGLLSTKRLLPLRTHPVFGRWAHRLLRIVSNIEVPSEVAIGEDLVIHHQASGLVVHPNTTIGKRVHIMHGVTIGLGRDRIWEPDPDEDRGRLVIEDDVWLCAGSMVIGGRDELRVGRGTVLGAGSVLLQSTGRWEIWAGAPARRVGTRTPSIWHRTGARPLPADDPDVDRQ